MGWTLEVPHMFQTSVRMSTGYLNSSCLSSFQHKYLKWHFLLIDALATHIQKWVRNISHVPSHQQTKSEKTQILPKSLMSSLTAVYKYLKLHACPKFPSWFDSSLQQKNDVKGSVCDMCHFGIPVSDTFQCTEFCWGDLCYLNLMLIVIFIILLQMDDKIWVSNLTFETIQKTLKHLLYSWESPLNLWDFPEDLSFRI